MESALSYAHLGRVGTQIGTHLNGELNLLCHSLLNSLPCLCSQRERFLLGGGGQYRCPFLLGKNSCWHLGSLHLSGHDPGSTSSSYLIKFSRVSNINTGKPTLKEFSEVVIGATNLSFSSVSFIGAVNICNQELRTVISEN